MASSLGLNLLKGHRICIGGTLEYLLCGVPFDVVEAVGWWSSDAFALHLHKHAMIMVPYLQRSPVLKAFTRYTMPPAQH